MDPSRAPLKIIQESRLNSGLFSEETGNVPRKVDKTPKVKGKTMDAALPLSTPEKHMSGFSAINRFGWAEKNEVELVGSELQDDERTDARDRLVQSCQGFGTVNGGLAVMTPRSSWPVGTPTASVSKVPNRGSVKSTLYKGPSCRNTLYKGTSISYGLVNEVEVPHFDLKEDPSFWMDHNVQVLIRIRPLNSMERSMNGYGRCLKQESAQTITWMGQPETRFTFDQVACETVEQEMLFRMAGLPMVENCLSGYNSCMFAYGQTGSGKTYTMLGDIEELEVKPSPKRGMTPRIFEFLFARIQTEEESRRDERLKYACKCSFLEIYNEQIIDLLDPSPTNLLLREDFKKGVYVENLSEYEVRTVGDILKLLTQGSSNRKVAATNMNKESSRSHSVFTCVIESRWEKDNTTNLRFARLNLVDLAGSERQKSSGAEGERLKEAANINKSLSTLGHVITVLTDVAHGKPKHVPYRDSRLTFLLQDSLGGNSKTMIIANVSPSICCAAETLDTLKFAQRAKLIQNNALMNEDSWGDVTALQHQIQLLKEELSILKHQKVSRSLSFGPTILQDTAHVHENACTGKILEDQQKAYELFGSESNCNLRMSSKQLKCYETTLAGALRREQKAETSIKQLEAEIEQLNNLVHQRETENRCTKMMLRFREDKIQRMESLVSSLIPVDSYLLQENSAISEEIQCLQTKVESNPEVTRFALENIRLLDQLRRFQDFYKEGERNMLLAEVSGLRDQLLQFLDGNSKQHDHQIMKMPPQVQEDFCRIKGHDTLHLELTHTLNELEECRSNLNSCLEDNTKLSRELDDLRSLLNNLESVPYDQVEKFHVIKSSSTDASLFGSQFLEEAQKEKVDEKHENLMNHTEEIMNLKLELNVLKILLQEEKSSHGEVEDKAAWLNTDLELTKEKVLLISKQCEEEKGKLKDAKFIIEALESEKILLINEMEDLRKSNNHYVELLSEHELEIFVLKEQFHSQEFTTYLPLKPLKSDGSPLQAKLKRMQDSFKKAKRLNLGYQNDCAFQIPNGEKIGDVLMEIEADFSEVITCLQEDIGILQQKVQDGKFKELDARKNGMLLETELKGQQEILHIMTQDYGRLHEKHEEKKGELKTLTEEWNLLIHEIEEVLSGGHEALFDISDQLDLKRTSILAQFCRLIRIISEKELLIKELNTCLEDAGNERSDMDCMMKSLRGATQVITEVQQQELGEKEKEIFLLTSQLNANLSTIEKLENRLKLGEDNIKKASVCATVAFVIVNRLSEMNLSQLSALKEKDIQLNESIGMNLRKDTLLQDQAAAVEQAEEQIQFLCKGLELSDENLGELRVMLAEEQKRACAMERKLGDVEENDILRTKEKLAELKTGVSTLRSCMSMYVKQVGSPEKENAHVVCMSADGNCEGQTDTEPYQDTANIDSYCTEVPEIDSSNCPFKTDAESNQGTANIDISGCPFKTDKSMRRSHDEKKLEPGRTNKDVCDREVTIFLLEKEIESALRSLNEVHVEIAKLHDEKEDIWLSKKQSEESMKQLVAHVLALQAAISNFEEHSMLKLVAFDHKLQTIEQIVQDTDSHWCRTKELVEQEVINAKVVAAQKTTEASCILEKFEEAQYTMKEADKMTCGLMIDNETMKLGIRGLKNEKDILANEVQRLQSINDMRHWQYENLEMQIGSSLVETMGLVMELEDVVQVETTFKEDFRCLAHDIHCLKSQVLDFTKLMRSWFEDISTEIIMKDCAVSVLHTCHNGTLLESITGLNAENALLHHMPCELNSVIADLRKHNLKSRREIELCRILKGELLDDLKNSFDCISRKDEETGGLSLKLTTFGQKISDLQLQEELVLQRFNNMGSELAVLIKELDMSNTNLVASLLDREKSIRDKEAAMQTQAEIFMVDLFTKDFQSLILALALEEETLRNVHMEKEQIGYGTVVENLKERMIFHKVDAELKEKLLMEKDLEVALVQNEVKETQKKRQDLLAKLSESRLRIAEMGEVNKVLEKAIQCQADFFMADFLENDFQSFILASASEEMALRVADMKNEQISYGAVLDSLKEGMIFLKVDAEMNEMLLVDKDVEVALIQNEVKETQKKNHNLLAKLNESHSRIAEMDGATKFLEEAVQSHVDFLVTEFLAQDFQSLILASALGEMALREADMNMEVEETQNKNRDLLAKLGDSHLRNAEMDEKNKVLEEAIQSQADLFVIDFLTKDFQSVILSSRLEEMALREADMKAEQISYGAVLDNLKEGMIYLKVNAEWEKRLLQNEVEETRNKNWGLLAKLGDSHLINAEMDEKNRVLEEAIQSQADLFMTDFFTKDFQSVILSSGLEEMALREADMKAEQISYGAVLDNLKEGIIYLKVNAEWKEILLQNEVEETQNKNWDLLANLGDSHLRIAKMAEENKVLEEAIQSQADLFMTDFYAKDFQSAILSSALEGMAFQEADMSAEQISYGAVIDNLKEGMIFLKVNAEWKEMLLQNEVEETQKKNWDLLAKLGDSHLRIAEMDKENKVLEEAIQSQADLFMTDIFAKDFQSLILASKLEEMALQETDLNMMQMSYGAVLDNLKEGMTLLKVDAEFKEMLLVDKDVEVALLQNEVENTVKKSRNLFAKLSESRLRVAEVDDANKFLELEVLLLKDVSRLNDALKSELAEVMEAKVALLVEVHSLEAEYENLLQELMMKEITLELSSKHMVDVDLENQKLERDIGLLKTSSYELQNEFIMKDAKMSCLEEENESLKNEVRELKSETGILFQDLQKKKSDYDSSLGSINVFDIENLRLQDENSFLEACIANLQIDMDSKITEMNELQQVQSVIMEELSSKTQDWKVFVNRINALEEENVFLKTELGSHEKIILKYVGTVESLDTMSSRVLNTLNQENMTIIDKIFEEICRCVERTSKYTEELECLEFFANNLLSENLLLQTELSRKDDVIKGLSLDLSQEHESASNDKDEIEKLTASFRALEDELAVKSSALDGAVSHIQMLEFQLHEKLSIISTLESDISNERESVKLLSSKNIELSARIEAISAAKRSIEEELTERKKVTDGLNTELFKMGNDLGHTNKSVDCLRRSLNKLTSKRDELHSEVVILKERLHVAEAQQKEEEVCANKKEEKMKRLEKSVEKQECSTTLVGHKVDPMTGEADLQILTVEEFALEFHGVGRKKHKVGDAERKRLEKSVEKQECSTTLVGHKVDPKTGEADLQILTAAEAEFALEFHGVGRKKHKVGDDERKGLESLGLEKKSLNETTKHIQNLEKDIAERNAKIAQFKGLNREVESSTTQTLRPMTRSMTRSMTHYLNPNPGPAHGKKCSKEGNLHEEAAAPRRPRRRATQSLTGPLMRGPNHDLCG